MSTFVEKLKSKIKRFITKIKTNVKIQSIPFDTEELGNNPYGSWTYAVTPNLDRSTIILCGAGEDISFDIEFSSKFKSSTFIVDPTPRAIIHVKEALKRIGKDKEKGYESGGSQDVKSYDMRFIKKDQIKLIENALWNQSKKLKFYCPKNPNFISHSILNFQNDYSDDSVAIDVDAINIKNLLNKIGLENKNIDILKLDIEGAEHEVIYDLISNKIYPEQILVEFDELSMNTSRAIKRFKNTHKILLENNYKLFAREVYDFSYLYCP